MAGIMSLLPREEKHHNPYGYIPTSYVCIIFITLFALSAGTHLGLALWTRKWYLLPTVVLCGLGEVMGWSGRLWSSKNVSNRDAHILQISTTIIAPTFLAAANFIIFGAIVERAGAQFSHIPAKQYAWIFVTIDIAALVVQAVGGAMASLSEQTGKGTPETGGHVMLAGIIIQLVEIVVYVALAANFFYNFWKNKPVRLLQVEEEEKQGSDSAGDKNGLDVAGGEDVGARPAMLLRTKLMAWGLVLSTTCLFIRAVYRTIELSNGWTGRIIHTQLYFNVLDGGMIVIAMFTLNFLHPGFLL